MLAPSSLYSRQTQGFLYARIGGIVKGQTPISRAQASVIEMRQHAVYAYKQIAR
jgi:hypothetical protein